MFKKQREEIDTARTSIKSALILSGLALLIAYVALIVALEKTNA